MPCSTSGAASLPHARSASPNDRTSHSPTAEVSSDGLNTTAFPAASAQAIDRTGVSTGLSAGPMTPITPSGS